MSKDKRELEAELNKALDGFLEERPGLVFHEDKSLAAEAFLAGWKARDKQESK